MDAGQSFDDQRSDESIRSADGKNAYDHAEMGLYGFGMYSDGLARRDRKRQIKARRYNRILRVGRRNKYGGDGFSILILQLP